MKEPETFSEKMLPPRRVLHVDGVRLSLVDVGQGEPVLLLHGYPQSLLTWRHQIVPLSQSARVVAPDWFGWGQSERRFDRPPRYWDEVDRIGLVMDALQMERCSLLAHDYGGFLALGFASRQPHRVKRLAIINSRAHRTFPTAVYRQFAVFCALGRMPLVRELMRFVPFDRINAQGLAQHVRQGCFDDAMLDNYLGWMRTGHGRRWVGHYFQHYELPAREDLAGVPERIECPTSIIWGDRDPYCPITIGEDLAARIPGSELVRVEGADHYVMEERPDDILAALRNLMERPAG